MPWEAVTVEQQRGEFVTLAEQRVLPFRELCRRFDIAPRTGYKWWARFREEGEAGLRDRSRRPHQTRPQVAPAVQEAVLAQREAHPCWGARKLRRLLAEAGVDPLPARSSITAVLHRHGRIDPDSPSGQQPWVRFERSAPNALWQMDFKAPLTTAAGRVDILSVLDDHSRFLVVLQVLQNQEGASVQEALVGAFRHYGLPDALLMDNGTPWGDLAADAWGSLAVWLMRLDISVTHSRPYHPQTLGKDERLHGTLERELLSRQAWQDRDQVRGRLAPWRHEYNHVRPHESLDLEVPASRYRPSPRPYPELVLPFEYPPGLPVRKVQDKGQVFFEGRLLRVSKAFRGERVALRVGAEDRVEVLFRHQVIRRLSLRECPQAR
jgi:transposase InsO family protein